MEVLIIVWIICAVLGYAVSNGRPLGGILGLLLGPIGVLIAVFVKE